MDDIKKAIIGVVTLAITTGGGLLMKNLFEGDEESKPKVEKTEEVAQPNITINIPEQKKDTVIKKVYVKPTPKKTETEKRKDEGLDW